MSLIESIKNLTRFEKLLWAGSVLLVLASFFIGTQQDWLTLISSLIGVTALIFVSKGDVLGQIITVIFAVFYGIISFKLKYYGEMITYLGMTAPIAVISVISWVKNPYSKHQVRVSKMNKTKWAILLILSSGVTVAFYFILKALGNASLIVSTISIFTSFLAASLTTLRSEYYAIAYSANDIVLIILWSVATADNIQYLPMVICFAVFLANDIYGYVNWRKIRKQQAKSLFDTDNTQC